MSHSPSWARVFAKKSQRLSRRVCNPVPLSRRELFRIAMGKAGLGKRSCTLHDPATFCPDVWSTGDDLKGPGMQNDFGSEGAYRDITSMMQEQGLVLPVSQPLNSSLARAIPCSWKRYGKSHGQLPFHRFE